MRIFLLGFMGSGKTYWGNQWSSQYKLSFIDLDVLIEHQQKKTIRKIFEDEGEEVFRNIEASALRSLSAQENIIVACGGGTPCFHENINWMNNNGTTVYLQSTPHQLILRLKNEKQKRPIIMDIEDDKMEDFIAGKLKERESFYNQAKIILNTEDIQDDTFSQKIVNHIS